LGRKLLPPVAKCRFADVEPHTPLADGSDDEVDVRSRRLSARTTSPQTTFELRSDSPGSWLSRNRFTHFRAPSSACAF
jgi:hypothetical protein